MNFESGPKIESAKQKQERCERKIEALLAELDKKFSSQEVNDALDRIFTPAREAEGTPRALDPLNEALEQLNAEFSEDVVTAALFEVDQHRNPPLEQEQPAEESPEAAALRESVIDAVNGFDSDTIALITGDDDDWEIHEFGAKVDVSLGKHPRSTEALAAMLDIAQNIQDTAAGDEPDKEEKIKELGDKLLAL
jgi:hypothetical protein